MNKITVLGRLTADVEIGETASGLMFGKFNLASRSKMRDGDGNYLTDFFRCTVWRDKAELLAKYTGKGSQIIASGSMHSRQYEDGDGKKRTVWELTIEDFEFAGSGPGEDENEEGDKIKPIGQSKKRSPIDKLPLLDDDTEVPF